jgi:hypothetical protein
MRLTTLVALLNFLRGLTNVTILPVVGSFEQRTRCVLSIGLFFCMSKTSKELNTIFAGYQFLGVDKC